MQIGGAAVISDLEQYLCNVRGSVRFIGGGGSLERTRKGCLDYIDAGLV